MIDSIYAFLAWFEECCECVDGASEPKAEVYRNYKYWHQENGYRNPLGNNNFGKELRKMGVEVRRAHRPPDYYEGISLRAAKTKLRVARG